MLFFQLVQHLPSANPAATEPPAQLTTPPPSTDTPANVSDFQHNAAGRCDLRSIFEVAGISDADLQRWIDNGDIADDAIDILNDPDCQLPLQSTFSEERSRAAAAEQMQALREP